MREKPEMYGIFPESGRKKYFCKFEKNKILNFDDLLKVTNK